ncbi:hypothetical protein KVH27_18530 [Streptomyces olivaceus]|uniref:hypothetical protein n=1 Tax=Streptomyces olivaceus TaxID=47716 RepID=UPI001CCBB751|nr:hypothetical protein [Streptomyces olivaceus]MBZ6250368.1 hypothetical protein [Streptomyces olivaceus]
MSTLSPREQRVAALHQQADADYASTAHLRRPPAALDLRDQLPTDLQVAVSVARQMLNAYGDSSKLTDVFAHAQAHGALTESLRILLRAVDQQGGAQ